MPQFFAVQAALLFVFRLSPEDPKAIARACGNAEMWGAIGIGATGATPGGCLTRVLHIIHVSTCNFSFAATLLCWPLGTNRFTWHSHQGGIVRATPMAVAPLSLTSTTFSSRRSSPSSDSRSGAVIECCDTE